MTQSTDARNRLRDSLFWGAGLLLTGIFLLLVNHDVFANLAPYWQWGVAALLLVAGAGFVISFARDTIHWWPIVPGFTLLTGSLIVFLTTTQAAPSAETLGAILFFGIALAFVVIYVLDRRSWWAVIPGGLLIVLSATTVLSNLQLSANALSTILFLGMGLVFLLVYVLGPIKREVWWALIPGSALILFALYSFVVTNARSDVQVLLAAWWPLLLVLVGILLLVRVFMALNRGVPATVPMTVPPPVIRPREEEPVANPGVATIRPQADVEPLIRAANPPPAGPAPTALPAETDQEIPAQITPQAPDDVPAAQDAAGGDGLTSTEQADRPA